MPRRRRVGRGRLFFALVLFGLLVGSSVWLDQRGTKVLAPVRAKHERVTLLHDPQGSWYRWYEVGVDVGTLGTQPWTATVEVPEARYDSLRIGDSIEVRYLQELPLFARTSNRSTATVVREAALRVGIVPLLIWIGCGIAGLWIAARVGMPAILAGGLAWMAFGFPVLLPSNAPVAPPASAGTATVDAITTVSKSPERRGRARRRIARSSSIRRLPVPYQVVQLRLAPANGDTVLVVDAVDSGSVANLAVGAEIPVRFDPKTPREGRLAQGTRSFLERNRYHFLPAAIGVPLIGMLAAMGFRRRRRSANP